MTCDHLYFSHFPLILESQGSRKGKLEQAKTHQNKVCGQLGGRKTKRGLSILKTIFSLTEETSFAVNLHICLELDNNQSAIF